MVVILINSTIFFGPCLWSTHFWLGSTQRPIIISAVHCHMYLCIKVLLEVLVLIERPYKRKQHIVYNAESLKNAKNAESDENGEMNKIKAAALEVRH